MFSKEAFQGPATMTRVFADLPDGSLQEGLVGKDGFYTFGSRESGAQIQVRGYGADGRKVFEWSNKLPMPSPQPTVDPSVTVKTVEPVTPQVVLTKDPQTGKTLAPPPPVSPLTDDQIRARCKTPDEAYFKGPRRDQGADQRPYDAGRITPEWTVVLKTGTGTDFTALLLSPGRNVVAWCHMLGRGDYDYGRSGVEADAKFADGFEWAMVPEGVAQIVVDLPKTGPTRALISNGYYIWGLTGGNSDLQTVRVRGFDAQGKQIYDEKKQIDAS